MRKKIILASRSPRRIQLLTDLGVSFTAVASDVPEEIRGLEKPEAAVMRISKAKAEAVAEKETGIIIAADTIVQCQDEIMGKPKNESEAYQQLRKLSGREHVVLTGLCVFDEKKDEAEVQCETSKVFFRKLSDEEINFYISTGEPLDKAGSYGIQGRGALFVNRVEGCYYNIVGLPLTRLYLMLKKCGVDLLGR
ncbi:MAG: Maf family protein [Syntrophomonadaceae bacterium]|nr:Maf family protein [Syntrophomonadaceae bacterium]